MLTELGACRVLGKTQNAARKIRGKLTVYYCVTDVSWLDSDTKAYLQNAEVDEACIASQAYALAEAQQN